MATKPTPLIVKVVEYAYPSSVHACKHGYSRTGCWIVETWTYAKGNMTTTDISAHAERSAAYDAAMKLPHHWSELLRRYNAPEIADAEARHALAIHKD